MESLKDLQSRYESLKRLGLKLNIERGQPGDDNFDLSNALFSIVTEKDIKTESGFDIRNYPGGVLGLPEARALFSGILGAKTEETMVGNNASLYILSNVLMWALLRGLVGSPVPWSKIDKPKMIVTVPGYDRHFLLLSEMGFEMIQVKMTQDGPDMTEVEKVALADPKVKGILFVPTYSNPTGDTVSDDTVLRLAKMKTAAPDFTIFADDAYVVHHLVDSPQEAQKSAARLRGSQKSQQGVSLQLNIKDYLFRRGLGIYGYKRGKPGLYFKAFRNNVHRPQQGGATSSCKIFEGVSGRSKRTYEGTRKTPEAQIRHRAKGSVEGT
jgi:Transcriptional regulators containing a DNA-binding HTH domain and an aminotransferase domain (MocR family) and their eukaryotic orthologs